MFGISWRKSRYHNVSSTIRRLVPCFLMHPVPFLQVANWFSYVIVSVWGWLAVLSPLRAQWMDGPISRVLHLCEWLFLLCIQEVWFCMLILPTFVHPILFVLPLGFQGSGADAPYHGLDMLFHAAGKIDALKFRWGPQLFQHWMCDDVWSFNLVSSAPHGLSAQVGIRSASWQKDVLAGELRACWGDALLKKLFRTHFMKISKSYIYIPFPVTHCLGFALISLSRRVSGCQLMTRLAVLAGVVAKVVFQAFDWTVWTVWICLDFCVWLLFFQGVFVRRRIPLHTVFIVIYNKKDVGRCQCGSTVQSVEANPTIQTQSYLVRT